MARFPALRAGFLIRLISLIVAVIVLIALPVAARAAFPGADGKIAFDSDRDGNYEIYAVNADASGLTRLTSNTTNDASPAWSPDGTKIAFMSDRDGNPEIYVMNANGSGQTRLTNSAAREFDPAWSPDGTKIVFVSDRDIDVNGFQAEELYRMNVDGTGQTRLTASTSCPEGPCPIKREPSWSPDGTKIAFTQREFFFDYDADPPDWAPHHPEIWSMNADGTGAADLTPTFGDDQSPDWSPNSTRIAFSTNPPFGGPLEIFAMNADGTQQTRITNNSVDDEEPAWSPRGSRLAYESTDVSSNVEIYVVGADGSGTSRVTNNPAVDGSPDWQPLQRPHTSPVGGSPLRVSLVPAFEPCETGAADSRHGTPFDYASCSNPTQRSSTVTVGPRSLGFARMLVCPYNSTFSECNPQAGGLPKPDVRLTGSIRDVKCAQTLPAGQLACSAAGADYNPNAAPGPYTSAGNGTSGAQPPCFPTATSPSDCLAGADLTEVAELPGATTGGSGTQFEGRGLRITDSDNDPAKSRSGTVIDIGFPIPLDCIPNPSTSQGSACGVNTTANALVPGVVTSGDTAVWQIGQVELRDSGPDGVRGDSDDEVFAVQGVFLP